MRPLERIEVIYSHTRALNAEVRAAEDLTLSDARRITDLAQEIKGWMIGIEDLLRVE